MTNKIYGNVQQFSIEMYEAITKNVTVDSRRKLIANINQFLVDNPVIILDSPRAKLAVERCIEDGGEYYLDEVIEQEGMEDEDNGG